jgi:hypothetical protein
MSTPAKHKAHAKGNPKITGPIKVVEHRWLNGASLWVKLQMWAVGGGVIGSIQVKNCTSQSITLLETQHANISNNLIKVFEA